MTKKTYEAKKLQAGLPIQKVESDFSIVVYIVIAVIVICFAGCSSSKTGACYGNKKLCNQGGNYSKTFKF